MAEMAAELAEFLGRKGLRARVVSISRMAELQAAIENLKQNRSINADFYPEIDRHLDFDYKAILPEARAIIVVASPQPPSRVLFAGRPVTIPPTYIYRDIWEGQLNAVSGFLEAGGYHAARARLPLKTLVVRSGLGRYGRNNVCYIPGMGSFHRLGAFYSDMPCEDDEWKAPEFMKACQTCTRCLESCPTGCIDADRFLVHADRCLTRFNESEEAMPAWIKPEWHNALLGCMLCQIACPLDRAFFSDIRDTEQAFTEAETQAILSGAPLESLAGVTQAKLEELCLADSDVYPLLKRNLSMLFNRPQ